MLRKRCLAERLEERERELGTVARTDEKSPVELMALGIWNTNQDEQLNIHQYNYCQAQVVSVYHRS